MAKKNANGNSAAVEAIVETVIEPEVAEEVIAEEAIVKEVVTEPEVIVNPNGSAEVAIVGDNELEALKQSVFGSKPKGNGGGGRDSKYKKFFEDRKNDIEKLMTGSLAELDITDIVALSLEKKSWTCAIGFNKTGFTTSGNASPILAVARVCQSILPEGDTQNYKVMITSAGMLKIVKA